MKGITYRQQQVIDFIRGYKARHGYPPTIRDIGIGLDISSLRGVTVHLDALEHKGLLTRSKLPRSIVLTNAVEPKCIFLPLLSNDQVVKRFRGY